MSFCHFHGPHSMKCNSENGGLLKLALEHTYDVMDRDFFCDCQLDHQHASVLRQLIACTGNKSAHLSLEFVVNISFYQLLDNNKTYLADNVKPRVHKRPQTFNVCLFRTHS